MGHENEWTKQNARDLSWLEDYYRPQPAATPGNGTPAPQGGGLPRAPGTAKKENALLSPIKIGACSVASMTAALAGSFTGDFGTVAGAGAASAITAICTVVYEHMARKTPDLVRKKKFSTVLRLSPRFVTPKVAGTAALGAVAIAGMTYGGITLAEAAAGKTLHGITTGARDYGTTLGGSAPVPQPSAPAAPAPSPSTGLPAGVTVLPTAPVSPSAVPSPSVSGSALPSAAPSVTVSPTALPTVTSQPSPSATGSQ